MSGNQWGHWLHFSVPSFSVLGFSCHLNSMCLLTWALIAIRRSRSSVVWRSQLQFFPKGIPLLTFWPSSLLRNSLRDHHVTDLPTFLLAPPTLPGFGCPVTIFAATEVKMRWANIIVKTVHFFSFLSHYISKTNVYKIMFNSVYTVM